MGVSPTIEEWNYNLRCALSYDLFYVLYKKVNEQTCALKEMCNHISLSGSRTQLSRAQHCESEALTGACTNRYTNRD